jgi:hypothetical protein
MLRREDGNVDVDEVISMLPNIGPVPVVISPSFDQACDDQGESDCHTLWFHGVPALGIPGAANWREERDARHLDRCGGPHCVKISSLATSVT